MDSHRAPDLANRDPILIDLALQGGGAHGAFTWGVLDRLLEEPWLRIDGISGTSAGAMNAVVLADGFMQGGGNGARAARRECRQSRETFFDRPRPVVGRSVRPLSKV